LKASSASQGPSSVEKACRVIREAIQSGRYPGGSWIREVAVAELAEVSRTSVRQALNLLVAEGFVELHPNRGAMVVDWTDDNLLQVFDLRAMLEGYGCELAALHRTEQEADALQQEADCFSELVHQGGSPDSRLIAESNNRFHRLILASARNHRLASLLVAVVQVPLVRQTFAKYDLPALQRSASQHQDLVLAIRSGDAPWARSTMSAHIHAAKTVIFRPQPPSLPSTESQDKAVTSRKAASRRRAQRN
jgi:DNA-binding GntR family transcriptional regulator